MRSILLVLTVMVLCAGQECVPTAPGGGGGTDTYQTAILPHEGFDFSAGETPENWEDSDGDTINWPPYPNARTNFDPTDDLWWRPIENTADVHYTKDMGEVTLESVTSVPGTWDGGTDLDLPALQLNHVYVVKCQDGYAKFLVTALGDAEDWNVEVQYAFSTTTTFGN